MKTTPILLGTAIVAAVAMTPAAFASDVELIPFIGGRGGASVDLDDPAEGSLDADAALSFGMTVTWPVRPDGMLEVFFDRMNTSFDRASDPLAPGPFDVTVDYLHFGGIYEPPGDKVRPFVAASLGVTHYDSGDVEVRDDFGFSGSAAAGARIILNDRLSLRLEARGYATFTSVEFAGVCGAGCIVAIKGSGWYELSGRFGFAIRL